MKASRGHSFLALALAGAAALWVRIDTLRGGEDFEPITMYWGNPAAPAIHSPARVFPLRGAQCRVAFESQRPRSYLVEVKRPASLHGQ